MNPLLDGGHYHAHPHRRRLNLLQAGVKNLNCPPHHSLDGTVLTAAGFVMSRRPSLLRRRHAVCSCPPRFNHARQPLVRRPPASRKLVAPSAEACHVRTSLARGAGGRFDRDRFTTPTRTPPKCFPLPASTSPAPDDRSCAAGPAPRHRCHRRPTPRSALPLMRRLVVLPTARAHRRGYYFLSRLGLTPRER